MRLLQWRRCVAACILASFMAGAAAVDPSDLLDPQDAFRLTVQAVDERTAAVEFRIAKGYYLYRDRFRFETESGQVIADAELPTGKIKEDQFFGKTETYRDHVSIRVPLSAKDVAKQRVRLKITSQGCADSGVCYTPQEQWVELGLPGTSGSAPDGGGTGIAGLPQRAELAPATLALAGRPAAAERSPVDVGQPVAAPPRLDFFRGAYALAGAFVLALLLGRVAAAGAPIRRARMVGEQDVRAAFRIGPFLALGVAGALLGWLGNLLRGALENPWMVAALGTIYVAVAALWGLRSVARGARMERWIDVLVRPRWSGVDALILASVLPLVAYLGDAAIGAGALMGLGLSGLLSRAQPQDGPLRELLVETVAIAMLAIAAWIAAPLLPDLLRMLAWSFLLVLAAVVLRATDALPAQAPPAMRLAKAIGVIALVCGVAVFIGAASGGRDPLRPLAALRAPAAAGTALPAARFERLATLEALEARIAAAGRPVMLDFYADWCVSCKEMEQFTFGDPEVRARLQRMLLLQVDVTNNTAEDKAILRRFGLFGPPGIVFFDASGREIREQRVIGYQPADRFVRVLDAVLDDTSRRRL